MSKYNEYAKRLDKVFRDVVREYNDLVLSVDAAQRTVDSYADARDGMGIAKKSAAITMLNATKEEVHRNSQKLFEQFYRDVDGLTMELKAAAANEYAVNPTDVDANAMELLKSGIMTGADYAAMVERFSNNSTMLRLIGKYADEARKTTDDVAERQKFAVAIADARNKSVGVVERFEHLARTAKIYSGGKIPDRAQYVQSMQGNWDKPEVQAAIENF